MIEQWSNRGVYFATADDVMFKIGHSMNVAQRLGELATGSPVKLTLCLVVHCVTKKEASAKETEYHKLFAADRRNGEWFKASDKMRGFIATLRAEERINAALRSPRLPPLEPLLNPLERAIVSALTSAVLNRLKKDLIAERIEKEQP